MKVEDLLMLGIEDTDMSEMKHLLDVLKTTFGDRVTVYFIQPHKIEDGD